MELPLPDVPVCKMPHKDEEGLMQPADQLSQPPQVMTIIIIIIIIIIILFLFVQKLYESAIHVELIGHINPMKCKLSSETLLQSVLWHIILEYIFR